MVTYDHIAPQFRHAVEWPAERRVAFLYEQQWIGYARADEIFAEFAMLLKVAKQIRPPCRVIFGDSNNGKTTLVMRFLKDHGEGYVDEEERPVRPVIVAQAPPGGDEKGLYVSILDQFSAPYNVVLPITKLRDQTVRILRTCRTSMVVIDEIHSVLSGGAKKVEQAMNALKYLCNVLQIPIVVVGTNSAKRILMTDEQHRKRFEAVELPLWGQSQAFQRLLSTFESTLPLRKASGLGAAELATRLHAVSGGNLGDLRQTLIWCAQEAIRTGREQIDGTLVERYACRQRTRYIPGIGQ